MAVDTSVVAKADAPALKPQIIPSKLAPTPTALPKYSRTVKNSAGADVTVADPRATRALVALMDVHAVNGGAACHWGGPAALAELNSAIHQILFTTTGRPWFEAFHYVNDAGHTENGVYALRALYGFDNLTFDCLKGFRSIDSKLTGHGESHLNPEGVLLSNGPLGSSLPQAQGLAMADKITGNDRVTICILSDAAAMEGEAKEAFAAIPGFASKGKVNPFVLVVTDNDTKLSGRISHDSYSMEPTFETLETLGWNVIKLPHGNDLQAAYLAVEESIAAARANPNKPVCLWAHTIKGFGVKATEESSSGGHGFPLANGEKIIPFVDEIWGGETPAEFKAWAEALRADWEKKEAAKKAAPAPSTPSVKKDKIQSGLSKGAITAAKEGYPVFSISADLPGSTGMSTFQKALPDRFLDVGVAESNMISTAAGFSKMGYIPIVDTFAQFGVTKGNLPLTMASLSQAPIIAVFSHAGFQDAADGASHQGLTYIAAVSSIPHTIVIAASCADEAESFIHQAIQHIGEARKTGQDGETVIFFIGRESYPLSWVPGTPYIWGKAQVLEEGTDITLVTCGALLGSTLKAAAKLKEQGKSATVINNPFVNRPDVETISAALAKTGGKLITVEDHQVVGGMGAQLIHALAQAGVSFRSHSLGVQGEFGQSAYTAQELYDKHGLGPDGIVKAAQSLL
jgi:transketolase